MSSKRRKDQETWCSDALHDLLGFADSSLASYLVSVASSGPQGILQVLKEGGVEASSDKLQRFAQALYSKCTHSPATTTSKPQKTNADWVKQAETYQPVELQVEESPIVKKSPRDKKERIRDMKKRRRRDVQSDSSDEDDVRVQRTSTEEGIVIDGSRTG
jgi:hypothetical protein